VDDIPRLKEVLAQAGERIGIDRAAEAGALWARWEEIVGDAVAEHAEPTSLRRGVLKIRATSAAWASEIGYLKEPIMRAANQALGAGVVTDVQVWTGPGPIRRRATASERGSEPARDEPSEPVARDPEEALARARAAWHKRARGGSVRGPR
jgi:predicted nucleic acid-binding Zn ribbon protein